MSRKGKGKAGKGRGDMVAQTVLIGVTRMETGEGQGLTVVTVEEAVVSVVIGGVIHLVGNPEVQYTYKQRHCQRTSQSMTSS